MVWHIFRKDLRLLWPFALTLGAVQFAAAGLNIWMDAFPVPFQLGIIALLLSVISLIGVAVLSVVVMHQDAVPGVRQDWLTRPIERRDLILAKLLFVFLIIQGPLLLADLGEGIGHGFGFPASFGAAAARNVTILCLFALPAVMIGAITRNLTEAFATAIVGIVIYVAVFLVGAMMLLRMKTSIGGTGLMWMVAATWYALAVAGTATVARLQYLQRRTALARYLVGAGGAAVILSAFLPWGLAYAFQQAFAQEPGAAAAVALTFNPQLGPFRPAPGAALPVMGELHVPLRLTEVPQGALVLTDRAEVRISDMNGRTLYEGRSNLSVDGVGSIQDAQLEVQQPLGSSAAAMAYQRVFIPPAVYRKLRDQPVRMEIRYFLTLFRPDVPRSLAATDGKSVLGSLGICVTSVDGDGDGVALRCVNDRPPPSCATAFLEYTPTGLRNPELHYCLPDYTPWPANWWPGTTIHWNSKLRFFDRSGLTRYPIDGSKIAESRVVIDTFQPRDHFTRRLMIPAVRLSDLAGAAG